MKTSAITYLLWFLGGFGVLGLHRFYLGRWVSGLIWFLTGGLLLFGAVFDVFAIPGMVRVENLSRQLLQQEGLGAWGLGLGGDKPINDHWF